MNITEDKKTSELTVTLEIESKQYKKILNEKTEEASSKIIIPGYRPGKAPKEKLLSHVNFEKIALDTDNYFVNKHSQEMFNAGREKNKYIYPTLVGFSFLPINKEDENSNLELKLTFPIFTYIENIKLPKTELKLKVEPVSQKDVDKITNEELEKFALLVPLTDKETTKEGDTVNIDFEGFVNGEAFEGGEAKNYELKLGSKTFIPGFEEQLQNRKVGWKGKINVTFPQQYASNLLKGKDAVFEVTINSAKKQELDITPEIIESVLPNAKSLDDLKEYYKLREKEIHIFDAQNAFIDKYIEEVKEKNKIVVHKEQVKNIYEFKNKEFEKSLKNQQIKKSEYLELLKKSEKELEDELWQDSFNTFIMELIMETLKDKYKVEVTQEKIDAQYEELSKIYKIPLEQIKQYVKEDNIKDAIFNEQFTTEIVKFLDKEGYEKIEKDLTKIKEDRVKFQEKLEKKAKEEKTTEESKKETKEKKTATKKTQTKK